MGKVQFTAEQQQVIDSRNANLLVSAAAGSGKTAVLTQRIISLITDPTDELDIDRILVVTFTKAAAAEMRERIASAIAAQLAKNPENRHLQRQAALLHNAQITTIDSFCLFVIRNNFGDIDLDPGFRIMDEGERKLLIRELLSDLLEENYEKDGNSNFLYFMEAYSNGATGPVEDLILSLYEFAMSHPDPIKWLTEAGNSTETLDFSLMQATSWWEKGSRENESLLVYARNLAEKGIQLCMDTCGPQSYLPCIEAWKSLIDQLEENEDFEKRYQILSTMAIPALSRTVGKEEDKELRAQVKEIRDRISVAIDSLKKDFYYDSPEHILKANQEISLNANELIRLTLDFSERFHLAKREKNVLDFSDMEHFALQILIQEDKEGNRIPSKAAMEYRKYFHYVMVDEYQDSNYVQEYILKSIASDCNYFMVGDVKQSIYRFRLARPEIFMEKYAAFSEEGKDIRIDLNKNFRSRAEVIECVNDVFSEIMRKNTAGMEYDERARLYQGADYPTAEAEANQTELLLMVKEGLQEEKEDISESDSASMSTIAFEARLVAEKIRSMRQQGFLVVDKESREKRPLEYRDIVILVRSIGGYDDEFRKILENYGIPVYATVKSGYFQTMEVRTVMNALKVMDNPLQDIPLYGTLNSHLHNFTEEDIALIRADRKKMPLYHAMKMYCETENNALAKRVQDFMEWLELYRSRVPYVNVRELIQMLLGESGYLEYVTALPGGIQRRANLMMLLEKASDFETTSYHGLFHFVRYITQLKEQEVDYGEAGILDENADVVRLMTIHKSKGLEFPVCFVCGMTKRMNKKDASKQVLMDMEYGIAMDDINPVLRYKRPGIKKRLLAKKIIKDSLAEEMRILYVAMTRAKEKLIMTGVIADADALMNKMPSRGELDFVGIMQSLTYLDFVMKALANAGRLDRYLHFVTMDDLEAFEIEQQLSGIGSKEQLQTGAYSVDESMRDRLLQKMKQGASYASMHGLYTKTTVSELKKEAYEDEESKPMFEDVSLEAYIPSFARTEENHSEGTKRGSAYHRVMELLPFAGLLELSEDGNVLMRQQYIQDTIEREKKSGRLSAEYADLARERKLSDFLLQPIASRMAKADQQGKLYKEKPFFLGIRADRVNPEFSPKETILVQGVIDVYFEENDELVVLDYKTDRVQNGEELKTRYHKQLEIYAEALEQITGKHVKATVIYSFALNCEILL